jgi:Xaa-Pro dipeptidase
MASNWNHPVARISAEERQERLSRLRSAMEQQGISAVLLGATESLRYFTGLVWHPSERLFCGVVTLKGLTYIVPAFERSKVETLPMLPGNIVTWEEHQSPYASLPDLVGPSGALALDEQLPLFMYHKIARLFPADRLRDAGGLIRPLRARKSAAEIALIKRAMSITLEVHRRAHGILKPGIRTSEIESYIDAQHRALGATSGSSFCIVSFGMATSLPHGASGDPSLASGDLILVDTGFRLDGYHSDLTRTYAIDKVSSEIERVWQIEREAQQAAFAAAKIGAFAETVDAAARSVLVKHGLGPGYQLPGLPHRTGHGLGLEIHETPNFVQGDKTPLAAGMCVSVEPMIVVPEQFGVRLEDHLYMTASGPEWFTQPQPSLYEPFSNALPWVG